MSKNNTDHDAPVDAVAIKKTEKVVRSIEKPKSDDIEKAPADRFKSRGEIARESRRGKLAFLFVFSALDLAIFYLVVTNIELRCRVDFHLGWLWLWLWLASSLALSFIVILA